MTRFVVIFIALVCVILRNTYICIYVNYASADKSRNSLDLMAELTIVATSAETTMMVSNLKARKTDTVLVRAPQWPFAALRLT